MKMKRNKEISEKAARIFGKVAEIIANNGAWVEMGDREAVVNACNAIGVCVNGGAFCEGMMQYFYI